MIAVLSHEEDFEAVSVLEVLAARGEDACLIDTRGFPQELTLNARLSPATQGWTSGLSGFGGRLTSLSELKTIWVRRPRDFEFAASLTSLEVAFARRESRVALAGLLRASAAKRWVPAAPEVIALAEYKPYQLAMAQRRGLIIPPTLITNNPQEALQFYVEHDGNIIYKTLGGGLPTSSGHTLAILTSPVGTSELSDFANVKYCACLFQAYVEKAVELRLTVIGKDVFAVSVDPVVSQDQVGEEWQRRAALHDWRAVAEEASYAPFRLEPAFADAAVALIEDMGLLFGTLDVIITPRQEYIFLEVNPNGQWGWIDERLNMGMVPAMASLLAA